MALAASLQMERDRPKGKRTPGAHGSPYTKGVIDGFTREARLGFLPPSERDQTRQT
jgi:hypothetical protein